MPGELESEDERLSSDWLASDMELDFDEFVKRNASRAYMEYMDAEKKRIAKLNSKGITV